ncbi:TetR/AcrR family transcriptional regulator [Marinivivus vitaminiproducens]|uniref:TetR/AcrR family transcriptional regulator n=1 Tax=Marinivivus vitaminiproducens TaxID=3035935 RepID=UPI0027A15164|nr:helix-turn-helix domain containing protein [Geminicoccaceae bacterium SCSIO 64248]
MPKSVATTGKRVRTDAVQNRARLIEAAKLAFAGEGAAASLEQIAREAHVGIGTLYRHFPTRDALIEAVYRQEIETLVAAAAELAEARAPMEALREWLLRFVAFLDTKMGIAGALSTLTGGPDPLYSGTPARLDAPVRMLVERARTNGELGSAVDPMNLLRAIVGVASIRPDPHWQEAAVQMVDILLRGAREVSPALEP